MDTITIVLIVLVLFATISYYCDTDKKEEVVEGYWGAVTSLNSNHGIQDVHLTVNAGQLHNDPYKYWRRYPWWLSTRNLHRNYYYPYVQEYVSERYRNPELLYW